MCTPPLKSKILNNISMNTKKHFQNVDKTKFNNIFLTYNMKVKLII